MYANCFATEINTKLKRTNGYLHILKINEMSDNQAIN